MHTIVKHCKKSGHLFSTLTSCMHFVCQQSALMSLQQRKPVCNKQDNKYLTIHTFKCDNELKEWQELAYVNFAMELQENSNT